MALLAGCGTTVPLSKADQQGDTNFAGPVGTGAAPASGTDGYNAAGVGGAGTAGSAGTAGTGSSATGSQAGSTSAGGGPASSGFAPSGASAVAGGTAASGANGPGITPSTVTIGVSYITDSSQSQQAFGADAVVLGDGQAQARAIIADINAHGGVAGRKLDAIYYAYDAYGATPYQTNEQAACQFYTRDNHAFFVVDSGLDVLTCLQKSGAVSGGSPNLVGYGDGMSSAQFAQLPSYFDVLVPSLDRLERDVVDALVKQNYFGNWNAGVACSGTTTGDSVGILAPDEPQYVQTVHNVMLPALAAHGIHVSDHDVYFFYWPGSTGQDGQAVTDIESAALRFCSDHVNHVIPLEQNGMLFFSNYSQSQHYTPRYGLNSGTGAEAYAGSLVPYAQLNGAVGVGWVPTLDLANSTANQPTYDSTDKKRCLSVLSAAGQAPSGAAAETQALTYCSALYTFQRAMNAIPAGSVVDQTSYLEALNGLGTVPAAVLPEASYAAGHHDAPTQAWNWQYSPTCKCMQYVGSPFGMG